MKRSATGVLTCVVVAGLASGCASGLPEGAISEEPLAAIIEKVSPCAPDMNLDGPDRREALALSAPWMHVVAVDQVDRDPVGRTKAGVTLADGSRAEVSLSPQVWPGIDWALAHGADLWFDPGDPAWVTPGTVNGVMIVSGDTVVFGGNCADQYFGGPLRGLFGGDTAAVLTEAVSLSTDEAEEVLGWEPEPTAAPEPSYAPGEAILSDHPDLMKGLHGLGMDVRITKALGLGETSPALCTRIAAGWNDCLNTDERTAAGVETSVQVDDTGVLEFWLLFDETDVTGRRGCLGTLTVPTDGSVDTVVLTIDTTGVDRDSLPAKSDGSAARLKDVSFELRRAEESST